MAVAVVGNIDEDLLSEEERIGEKDEYLMMNSKMEEKKAIAV